MYLAEDIAAKHKFFVHDMKAGDEVIMYGVLVGKAQSPIACWWLDDNSKCKTCSRSLCIQALSLSMAGAGCFQI